MKEPTLSEHISLWIEPYRDSKGTMSYLFYEYTNEFDPQFAIRAYNLHHALDTLFMHVRLHFELEETLIENFKTKS